ncbi:PHP domain-containing protein [Veillonella criceti]|uniref:Histidinol phosphatase and related hydrolases of the PHP family n=1 Tax=Veillonella criceti TaxID=103891 RepID=A0A380NJB9_9FIRM|nr:PHP domain-containing protein [Veillonella criceti]SUP41158.1 Histidinol phosphatase and related hydrolases of the PHP family [Veillonella criceti]
MLVDFHMHSTASDGVMRPLDLREANKAAQIKLMALTDHDTIEGSLELLRQPDPSITVIPGCEFSSTYHNGDVHILGYAFDYTNKELLEYVAFFKESRQTRIFKMTDLCKKNGYDISVDELKAMFPHANSLGRPHLSQLLIAKGYCKTVSEAFNTILHRTSPCYVPKFKAEPSDVIDLIHRANGLAVMAHPVLIRAEEDVHELLELPFDGIEVYHVKQSAADSAKYRKLAIKHKLFITGGSDYHGIPKKEPLAIGDYLIQSDDVAEFLHVLRS